LDVRGVKTQLFFKVEDLFDKNPPKVASTAGTSWASTGSDANYYDLVGRTWRAGVRFRY